MHAIKLRELVKGTRRQGAPKGHREGGAHLRWALSLIIPY